MPVVVEAVAKKDMPVTAELVARTVASGTYEIRPNVEGQLIEMSFTEGGAVRKGQVLFRIDARRYEASVQAATAALQKAEATLELAKTQESYVNAQSSLRQAEANLQKATQDVTRLRPLAAERAVPERDLDAALAIENVGRAQVESAQATLRTTVVSDRVRIRENEAAVESAKAALAKAKLDLADTVITSPADGIIGRSEVSTGNYVHTGQTLLATISTVNPIHVEFNVPEADYLQYSKTHGGARAIANIELLLADNTTFDKMGRIITVERAVDEKTGTILVQAAFANPTALVRPGQFARVRFSTGEKPNSLVISEKAVMEVQGTPTVYVVDGQKIAVRTIAVERSAGGSAVVLSGLTGNEQVVVEGQVKVRPGSPVTIVPARKD